MHATFQDNFTALIYCLNFYNYCKKYSVPNK